MPNATHEFYGPNEREIESKVVCRGLVYLCPKMNVGIPAWAHKAAASPRGDPDRLEHSADILLKTCSMKGSEEFIYDGRNPEARALADWWDRQQTIVQKTEAEEALTKQDNDFRAAALAKLSAEEKRALGL